MNNKQKFLQSNVGFHFEDLSLIKQVELQAIMSELNLSQDWVLLALSKDSLESWEKWGFTLFRKPEFRNNIDNLLTIINKMDESKFKKEVQKKRGGKEVWVSEETFLRIWEGVREQGGLLLPSEAANRGLTAYWTYGNALKPSCYADANMMFASDSIPDEDEWLNIVLAAQFVKEETEEEEGE